MDPITVSINPALVAASIIFLGGVISALLIVLAWIEEDRDQELSKHTEDILSRYMRR